MTFSLADSRKSSLTTIVAPLDTDVYIKPKLLESKLADDFHKIGPGFQRIFAVDEYD